MKFSREQKFGIFWIVLIVSLILLCLFSCNDIHNTKYHKGDIVYLKPDSTKAVVVELNYRGWFEVYDVKVSRTNWYVNSDRNVSEEMIYSK